MKKDDKDVYSEYGEGNSGKVTIIIIIIVMIISAGSYFFYINFDSIKSTVVTQYNKKFKNNSESKEPSDFKDFQMKVPPKGTKIYNIDDVIGNLENAKIAEYVQSTREKLIYNNSEGAIFFAKEELPSGTSQYYVIHVDKVIDSVGNILPINKCIKNDNLEGCLQANQEYIVSEPDKAIIDVNYFREQSFQNIIDSV